MCHAVALLAAAAAVSSLAAPPAQAKHRKPIVKKFAVRNTMPWPAEVAQCSESPHGLERHVEKLRAPEAGVLTVRLTNFVGDYDLAVYDGRGVLAVGNNEAGTSGGNPSTGSTVETLKLTLKRATAIEIHVCNFAAGPNADGEYTFTYAR